MNRAAYALTLLAFAAALAIAGCGGSGNSSDAAESTAAATPTSGAATQPTPANGEAEESGAAYVALASAPKLGLVLVDSKGFVLYDFANDGGTTSACYGACAKAWPPLLTEGAPQPSNGASGSKLGTTRRKDGTTQVTYAGHPLYAFAEDKKPGEANGNGASAFGARWHALKGSGEAAGD